MANKNPKKFTKRLVLKITPEQELAWKELDKDSKTNIINFMKNNQTIEEFKNNIIAIFNNILFNFWNARHV